MPSEETCVFTDNLLARKTAKIDKMEKGAEVAARLRKNYFLPIFGMLLILLTLWVLCLTVTRELQMNELRSRLDTLGREVETLKNDRHSDELRTLGKEVNKIKSSLYVDWYPLMEDDDRAKKLGSTDLKEVEYPTEEEEEEEEYEDEEEEMEDEEEEEDNSSFEIKTLDSDHEKAPLKKIMRIPRGDLEDEPPKNRTRRDVIAETPDGVPVLEESYRMARERHRNGRFHHLKPENMKELPDMPVGIPKMLVGWDSENTSQKRKHLKKYEQFNSPPLSTRSSGRTRVTNDERLTKVIRMRRPQTKSGPTSNDEVAFMERLGSDSDQVRHGRPGRRSRKMNGERRELLTGNGDMKVIDMTNRKRGNLEMAKDDDNSLVAHFNGDTSNFRMGDSEYYHGNGRLGHEHDVTYTAWKPTSLGFGDKFQLQDGSAIVPEDGVYFVYAQIHYHDGHDKSGYNVIRSGPTRTEMILQCITTSLTHHVATTNSNSSRLKNNSCYTAGAFRLSAGDQVYIKNVEGMRYILMEPGKSFFGLIKVAH